MPVGDFLAYINWGRKACPLWIWLESWTLQMKKGSWAVECTYPYRLVESQEYCVITVEWWEWAMWNVTGNSNMWWQRAWDLWSSLSLRALLEGSLEVGLKYNETQEGETMKMAAIVNRKRKLGWRERRKAYCRVKVENRASLGMGVLPSQL